MQTDIYVEKLNRYQREHDRKRKRALLVAALSLIVVVTTVLVLTLPAATLETVCGMEAHQHGPECYSSVEIPAAYEIVCGFESGEAAVVHTHDEYCYDADGALICELPELAVHTHTDGCFADGELICDKEEIVLHTHTEECADGSCGLREVVAHQHTAECVRVTEARVEQELVCEIPEHFHTPECYPAKKASAVSYSVNGKTYSFGFTEQDKITFSELVVAAGVLHDADADAFPAEVENVGCPDDGRIKITRTEDDWELERIAPFDGEAALTVTMKNGDSFTVTVTDAPRQTHTLNDSCDNYDVTVTYEDGALIPDGSKLKLTEFTEGMAAFEYARRTVLADKQAKGEPVDFTDLSVLDISIIDPDGNEIEPAIPVRVDMTVKSLPGVENLNEVAPTLTVNHHVETDDGVVVETVYDGGSEASFLMETDAACAADGTAVDPDKADLSQYGFSSLDLRGDGSVTALNADDGLDISFPTPVFSTFTVTWGDTSSSSNTANYRWRSGTGYSVTTYGQVTFHYVDQNGNPIGRPSGIDENTNDTSHTGNSADYSISIEDTFGLNISGYTYQGAHYNSATGDEVTSVQLYRANRGTRYIRLNNGSTQVYQLTANGSGTPTANVYLVYSGSSGDSATVHYVDEEGNELTVSNGQPVNDTNSNLNYLIYDVDGYEYAYTYRNSDTESNRITPALRYNSSRWQYTTSTSPGNSSWSNLASGDDVYVVYKQRTAVPQGGTPVPKITGAKPDAPTITKESQNNGDGTNTLSLSVSGHTSVMEAEKLADVIVVYDVSGSMRYEIDSESNAADGERRMDYAQNATKLLANSLLGKNTAAHPELVRMSLISFSNTAELRQEFTTSLSTFNSAVTNLPSPNGGTNWEKALTMANEMAVESDRATFVIFVTDGNPTFRQSRGVLNNGGTGGIGDSDVNNTYYYSYKVYGSGSGDKHDRNYNAALTQAESIVSHNKIFYTIGISNDVTILTNLTTQAGAGADHSKTATSEGELITAFNDIAASVIAHLGQSDIKITDGITDLTQTVQKSDLVTYADDDFTYYKGHPATAADVTAGLASAEGEMVWVSWTPSSEGCAEAVYNTTTGAVEWNMGTGFMPQDGYTYQVRFKVWPSQAAYDLLADLNNGKKSYDSLSDEEKAQITEPQTPGGMYTLKTNSDTGYTYKEATKSGNNITPTGDASTSVGFSEVEPLELTTKPLKVQKQWHHNYVDSRTMVDQISMELYGVDADGVTSHDFKTITLTKDEGWYAENNYISYGLVTYDTATNSDVKIYESGHDFTLRETDDEAHYYELTAGVFRAMVINGTPTILERMDSAPAGMSVSVFHYSDASGHYYRLDGHVYKDTESDILLIATNTHRSYMDFAKTVVDDTGAAAVDDTEFEYNIRFTVPAGIDNYDSIEKYIWFSVYDSVGRRTLSPSEYTYANAQRPADVDSAYSGSAYANYLIATSGTDFTLKIKQGWNVRFLNLPNGTTYSFEEVNVPSGYDFVKAEVGGTRWISNMVGGTDQGSSQAMTSLPSNTGADSSNTGISGTIDYANARYETTYTNKTVTSQVKILKTTQNGTTPLQDAVFTLYSESGYTSDPKKAVKTNLTSDEHGLIDLGKLSYGKYYLVENAAPPGYIQLPDPVVITVGETEVTYVQNGNNLSVSGSGVAYDPVTATYTLTVTNNAGYELPSTGGHAALFLYVFGAILTLGAGTLLLWRRRRKV